MTTPNPASEASMRLPEGGRVDRDRTVRFTFDGRDFTGHPGDTVASALLAAGVLEVAPSTYAARPRGIFTASSAEPNALVEVQGGLAGPMVTATTLPVCEGLVVHSLSGIARLPMESDTAVRDKKYVHYDVTVIGGGPAGIAAALAAGRGGARVLLVDEQPELGGSLLDGRDEIGGTPAPSWVAAAARELAELPEVRVLTSATAVGHYDHNYLLVHERKGHSGHRGAPEDRLWHVRSQQVVLASGAQERPIVFADNDRPGIMLASAVRSYLNRYAVLPGRRAVVFTTSDSAYSVALDLAAAGAEVPVLVDSRPHPPANLVKQAQVAGVEVRTTAAVVGTEGDHRVSSVDIMEIDAGGLLVGETRRVDCDLLAVCGGWNPALALFSQAGGTLRWEDAVGGFIPARQLDRHRVVGAARGNFGLAACLEQGFAAGAEAATATWSGTTAPDTPAVSGETPPSADRPLWLVPAPSGDPREWRTHFVDLQRDATVADIWRATGAGMRSVEHVKRYTTISTGADQGRTASVNAIGVLAEALGAASPGEVGTTTARPPYTPVPFTVMAGRDRGHLSDPVRTTPMHSWHVAAGAKFEDVGQWKRPWYYPRGGEDMDAAVRRECLTARTGVAMQDVSTLGKIEVVGPDAPEFLNRIYTNGFAKLPVGAARYGMMCTADGMVFDDGVSLRLAQDRYLMSTTTGGAARVLDWLEEWLQTEWPELAVHCTSVTEQWAGVAVVGPDSRTVVGRLAPDLDVSVEAFPFMTFRETTLACGVPARICRISFSGELAFEINVPSWYGLAVWEAVAAAGEDLGITPYGTETMHVLRAEKGFVIVGQDTDGTVTPYDLGMDWVVSRRKDFIGKRSFTRPDTARTDRQQLVGLLPESRHERLPDGAQLIAPDTVLDPPVPMLGHVTSSYYSAVLDRTFALALVARGRELIGEVLHVPVDGRRVPARVTEPVFYDKEGARRDGR